MLMPDPHDLMTERYKTLAKDYKMMTVCHSTLNVMRLVLVAALMVLAVPVSDARGQCAARWLPGQGLPGANGVVYAMAVLPDGDVIVGGQFTTAGTVAANSIARYNPTTGVWSALGSGVGSGSNVFALAVLPGGDLIVGGRFVTAGGVAANRIARYNPTTGVWSALGSGVGGSSPEVVALAVLPGGDVIVGGEFATAGGLLVRNIARYNPTTGVWSALGTALGSGTGGAVNALTVLPGGDLIVGGNFFDAVGVFARYIARYNPTTGVWSALGSGANGEVLALAVLPGGDVIVGGFFTGAGTVAANNIARVNPTTGVWSALGSGTNREVLALAVLPDGDVIVGGTFTNAGGIAANRIARYNPTTGVWSTLGSGTNNFVVSALAVLPGGDLIAGGDFSLAGGVPANNIARYNPTTGVWSAVETGTNGRVNAVAVLPGGDVIVGGAFTTAGGVQANNIARYNPTTGLWSALGSGVSGTVSAVAVLPGGDVIVGGIFTTAGGVAASRVARYSPTTEVWSPLGSGVRSDISPSVSAIAVLPGGDVIVGGVFATAGDVSATNIARYNPSTNTWSAMGSGTNGDVKALAVLPGGDVIVAGILNIAGGVSANWVARYNPTTDAWSALGSGTSDRVNALAVLPGGDVIVAGAFTTAGGVSANRVARYSPTTGVWSALGNGVSGTAPTVFAVAVLPGGDVIVGGFFNGAGTVGANNIARVNPTTGVWSALGSGTNNSPLALAVLPGGVVIVGGNFLTAGGNVSAYFARYTFGSRGPSITTHPAPVFACLASSATFSVTAAGTGPFTYQWRKGNTPINAAINPSAATAVLTLNNVGPADAGAYSCVITDACGSVTSNAATLGVVGAKCNPADIAVDNGAPLPPLGPCETNLVNNGVTEGDYNLFFATYFDAGAACDIADDQGTPLPPFGNGGIAPAVNSGVTRGDYNLFFSIFFDGCAF
jgi:uncharacterized delta-60 repeat protein